MVKLLETASATEAIFADVPVSKWSNAAVAAAVKLGIIVVSEYGDTLGAEEAITREETAERRTLFEDDDTIGHKSEIAAAVEIGLIMGMPGNLFAPGGSTTCAQAAVLITRMQNILASLTPDENIKEVFKHEYRRDVSVVGAPPSYTFEEADGMLTIEMPIPNEAILKLSAGDKFVLEPTAKNPGGLAGVVKSISTSEKGASIYASVPGSIDEIYGEFEFVGNIDLLSEDFNFDVNPIEWNDDAPFLSLGSNKEHLKLLSNTPSIQQSSSTGFSPSVNLTSKAIVVSANNATWKGITLEKCQLTWELPKIHANISIIGKRVDLYVTTAAQFDFKASASFAFDTVIPLYSITVWPVWGVGIEIPIGVRITANGEYSFEIVTRVDMAFGIMNNMPSARASFNYSFDFNHNTRATMSLNIQAKARVLGIEVYGVQGDIGKGIQMNKAMQNKCQTGLCFVVETFNVLSISSLDWGLLGGISLLRFNVDFAKNMPSSYWFRSGGKWNRICTHREFKPGDDPSEYQYLLDEAIPYSQLTPGAVTTAEPTQRYIIVLLLPGTIEVNVTTDGTSSALPNQGADVVWYNADRSRLGGSNGGIGFPYFDSKDLAAGVYYIDVAGRGGVGQTGTYNIRVDYINSEKEPNNTMSEAQLLVSGLTVRGASITAQDSVDTYRYELTQPGRLTVNVTRGTLKLFFVTWFDADGKQIGKNSNYNDYYDYSRYMDLEAGVYFIEITTYNNNYSGMYELTITSG